MNHQELIQQAKAVVDKYFESHTCYLMIQLGFCSNGNQYEVYSIRICNETISFGSIVFLAKTFDELLMRLETELYEMSNRNLNT